VSQLDERLDKKRKRPRRTPVGAHPKLALKRPARVGLGVARLAAAQRGECPREGERRDEAGRAPTPALLDEGGAEPFGVVESIDHDEIHRGVDGYDRFLAEDL